MERKKKITKIKRLYCIITETKDFIAYTPINIIRYKIKIYMIIYNMINKYIQCCTKKNFFLESKHQIHSKCLKHPINHLKY